MKKFYLTTPIYYPNARPHVGSAYTTIACDVIARYKRMCGYDVAFLTGTDEHGEKLQRAADDAGIPVEKFVAEKRELFKDLWRTLGIGEFRNSLASAADVEAGLPRQMENSGVNPPLNPIKRLFVHTSQNPGHVKSVHWMIRQADKAGYVEKKRYEGRYCIFDERYVSDSPEPVNCDICGRPAELISEENYFFRLSAFQERLLRLYEDQPEFVLPDFRMNEVKSFVKGGLRDISISRRRLKWGIPWPDDPDQVVYVWYDALTSYLTGIGFEGDERSKDFEKYWMGAEGPPEAVHMIGKDILRFHAVYWPAFLWAAGLELPKTIFAHGWIYYQQDKMSKSKGNVVYPEPIVKLLGNDALRYYLLRDTPFGLDGSFSYEGLIRRYNSDLANDLGNLANRTITMVNRYLAGVVPNPSEQALQTQGLRGLSRKTCENAQQHFDQYNFSRGIDEIWKLVGAVNQWLSECQPWTLAADPSRRGDLESVLYTALQTLRVTCVLTYPIMPSSAEQLWKQLGQPGDVKGERIDGSLHTRQIQPGAEVGKPEPIFPRLDKEATLRKLEGLAEVDRAGERSSKETKVEAQSEQKPAPVAAGAMSNEPAAAEAPKAESPKISIDDFAKVDLRAGTILSAEPIPGATKLLKLQVDIGTEVRQVCAGIAEYYKPEDLVGMKIVLVANLQPRKMRGVESNGMIVAASVGDDGRPVLATFKEDVPDGAKLK